MKLIQLSQGKFATIDDEDFEKISKHKWFVKKSCSTFYAVTNIPLGNGKKTIMRMHRYLLGVYDPKIKVDHKNLDGLCNEKSNLRLCTNAENTRNRRASKSSKSGIKGVSWSKSNNGWHARVTYNGKEIYLGTFNCRFEASNAYDKKCVELFGEFARPNNLTHNDDQNF